ncbi:hypothetical protein UN63_00530 [Oceanisphaera arctica]|uniref:AB hydrolase-1 domain-containing protein n=2 Tax=Oceanisphaera arctica TaxID=641510 RepID=A0A2P5TRZ5_9GAMM|nr:hypothetical protein UN63_00530 [Oceanisphaera arctica]
MPREQGCATSWICLRGLMREQRHWGAFPALFRQQFPQDTLILADLPGFGTEYASGSPATIKGITERLRRRWQSSLLQQPVYLLTLSLGGMVAIDWASRYPQQIAGIVLMNSSLSNFSPFYRRLSPAAYLPLLKLLLWPRDPWHQEAAILSLTSHLHPDDPELLAHWVHYARQYPARRLDILRQLLAALSYRAPKLPPPVPIMMLGGLQDRLVSPSCSESIATHWLLPLHCHALAGHDLTLDAGDWVCEQIAAWLNEALPSTAG